MKGGNGVHALSAITGRDPNTVSIREFGELGFVHIPSALRAKNSFDTPKAFDARVISQDEATSGWIIRLERNGEVVMSRDVVSATSTPLDTPLTRFTPLPLTRTAALENTQPFEAPLSSHPAPLPPPPTPGQSSPQSDTV